jgi:DNA polymerase-1
MLKKQMLFNELEFRRMANNLTPFSKGDSAATTTNTLTTLSCIKKTKKTKISLIFLSTSINDSDEGRHQFYNTLDNTTHSYQIVQGDLGLIAVAKFTIKLQCVLIPKLLD